MSSIESQMLSCFVETKETDGMKVSIDGNPGLLWQCPCYSGLICQAEVPLFLPTGLLYYALPDERGKLWDGSSTIHTPHASD